MENIKTIQECQECKLNRGLEEFFVCCGRTKQFIIMVPVAKKEDKFVIDCGLIA
jgi:hypothetical protein